MSQLRDKENGCEWDKEQTFESIAPYTIEEAYEVADAIDRGNIPDLKEELGDFFSRKFIKFGRIKGATSSVIDILYNFLVVSGVKFNEDKASSKLLSAFVIGRERSIAL